MNNVITDPSEVTYTSVLLIDQNGQNLGLKSLEDALSLAEDAELDLTIVNENGNNTVCRIMDLKKKEYQKRVAERKGKQKQKTVKTKEIRVNAGISENDLNTKTKAIDKFLSKGHHVKVTIKSRERRDPDENLQHMKDYLETVLGALSQGHKIDGKPASAKNQYTVKIVPE